jgi:hypothetical protein
MVLMGREGMCLRLVLIALVVCTHTSGAPFTADEWVDGLEPPDELIKAAQVVRCLIHVVHV